MYPRVKVREQEEYDDQYDFERRSLQSLKALESLSLDDFSSPDDSRTSVVRVSRLPSSISASPSAPGNKGARRGSKQNVLEEKTTNIRASPVQRPRAVLSSPDNDGKITGKTRRREKIHSGLKNDSHCQNQHIQCKFIPRPVTADVYLPTRKQHKQLADSNRNLRATRQRKVIFEPSGGMDDRDLLR